MEKKKRGEGGYKESEGCWEGGEHRGVKLGQHSDLTNLCRCGGIKKNVFKDLSAPPLVLASDMKIYFKLKGTEILCDSKTSKDTKYEIW